MTFPTQPISSAAQTVRSTAEMNKQRALDKLAGHPDTPRRPLTGYERFYEVASDGALYSIRLQRFLQPVYNKEHKNAELEFEFSAETIRVSPGKAVAMSFFSAAQRERIAEEAYDIKSFDTFKSVKGHPAVETLAYKYDVSEGAIFYILLATIAKHQPHGAKGPHRENFALLQDNCKGIVEKNVQPVHSARRTAR